MKHQGWTLITTLRVRHGGQQDSLRRSGNHLISLDARATHDEFMSTTSFSDQLNDIWRTRPARLSHTGKIAGVCSGVGHRYNVDPVLVRVAFIVSAFFGGAGIVLYFAAWLLFPKDADEVSAGEALLGRGKSSQSTSSTIMVLILLAITASIFTPVGLSLSGSGLVSFVLMLAGWWLLYQRCPVAPPLPSYVTVWTPPSVSPGQVAWTPPEVPQPFPGAPTPLHGPVSSPSEPPAPATHAARRRPSAPQRSDESPDAPATAQASSDTRQQPPSWDPLGVAPFAWDLPEPTPAHEPVPVKPRSRLTAVTLGLAIIVAAGLAAVAFMTGATWLTAGRIGAAALAVIGLGLLVGAFRGVGHGLVPVAAPLAGFVVIATIAAPFDFSYVQAGVGERTYRPVAISQLQPEYRLGMGSLTLDLRDLDLTEDATVDASVGMGELIVHVPDDINVLTSCDVGMGEMACPQHGLVLGAEAEEAPQLTVNASVRIGKVEILHG